MRVGLEFKARAQAIASHPDALAAEALIREYPVPTKLSKVASHTLRLWGDVAFVADDLKNATRIFAYLSKRQPDLYWPFFQLGRISIQIENPKDAARMLSRACELAPQFAWSWFELCRCLLELNDSVRLKWAAVGFASADPVVLHRGAAEILSAVAHHLFDQHHREESYQLYKLLLEQSFTDDLIVTRHAEYSLSQGNWHKAIELLEPLHRSATLGKWGLRCLASAYSETGRLEEAETLLAMAIRADPNNVHFVRDYLQVLHQRKKQEDAEALLVAAESNLTTDEYEGVLLAHLTFAKDYTALADMLNKRPTFGGAAAKAYIRQAINNAAYRQRDYLIAQVLIDHYLARYGKDLTVTLCQITIAFSTRNWSLAREVLAEVSEEEFQSNLDLRVKRFEYFCETRALPRAAQALDTLQPVSNLPKRHLPLMMRYFAEIGDWNTTYVIGMRLLDVGFDFKEAGHLTFRAIRKTGMHVPALRQIEQHEQLDQSPSLKTLRTIIMEDMIRNEQMIEDLTDDPHLADLESINPRLFFKKLVLQGTANAAKMPPQNNSYAIFYCTNEDYLCPTFVSLVSLAASNPDIIAASDIFIVVDERTYPLAEKLSSKLFKQLRRQSALKTRDAVIKGEGMAFKLASGPLTGHDKPPGIAYYPVFFAQALHNQGCYEKALYIHSDTVIQGSLRELFATCAKTPLVARLEERRPQIDVARSTIKPESERSFNLGTLLFNLQHAQLGKALDQTLQALQDQRHSPSHHHRRSLNIGFRDAVEPLAEKYNFFVEPTGKDPQDHVAVIHYRGRPKPWDPAYSHNACRYWFSNWYKLAVKIGGREAMALYSSSNKG